MQRSREFAIDTVTDSFTGLPRLALARLPTPLEDAPRLAAALGVERLLVKREDLSGYALGGNKLRKLDFIFAEALAAGADTVVSTASVQSNFCRALAGGCAKLGLRCRLLLRGSENAPLQGNLLLDHIFGAHVNFTARSDPWDVAIRAELDVIVEAERSAGRNPHLVQLIGPTAGTAIAAWAAAAAELAGDFERIGVAPHTIVLAAGSGLTAAGLALGFKRLGGGPRVVAMSVQQPAARLPPWMIATGTAAAEKLGWPQRLAPDDLAVRDEQIAPGYGLPNPAAVEAVRLAGRTEALALDPAYSGKALAGLDAALKDGTIAGVGSVVFIHSGGTPGLFANAAAFA